MGTSADTIDFDRGENIYNVSWGKLIGRNFVAGISRALGGLFFNLIFLVVLGSLFARYLWPEIQTFVRPIFNAAQTINQLGTVSENGTPTLFGNSLRFDIHDLGQPGSDPKSVQLDANQLEQLLFPSPTI